MIVSPNTGVYEVKFNRNIAQNPIRMALWACFYPANELYLFHYDSHDGVRAQAQ